MTKQEHREIAATCMLSMREATGIDWTIRIDMRPGEPAKFSAMPMCDANELSSALLAFCVYHTMRGWRKPTLSDAAFALLLSWCLYNQKRGSDV